MLAMRTSAARPEADLPVEVYRAPAGTTGYAVVGPLIATCLREAGGVQHDALCDVWICECVGEPCAEGQVVRGAVAFFGEATELLGRITLQAGHAVFARANVPDVNFRLLTISEVA